MDLLTFFPGVFPFNSFFPEKNDASSLFFFFFSASQVADVPLELTGTFFLCNNSNSETALPEFFLLAVFLLLLTVCCAQPPSHEHHQPCPIISADSRPQMCAKSNISAVEAHGELLLHLVRFFFEKREREREGEVWDSSCSFLRLTPPFGLLPPLLAASLRFLNVVYPFSSSLSLFKPTFFLKKL